MTYVVDHLTNRAYGYPQGQPRRIKPIALACAHITANDRTAAYTDLHAAAQAERDYANRAGSQGPSAHYYVARDGWAIEAIDPEKYAAWSNGDLQSPNTANPGIRAVDALDANPNEAYWLEFENVGYGSTYPVNAAQKNFMAERIAAYSISSGLPISRVTVHGHWEINGVDKVTCPSAGTGREAWLDDLVARAQREREKLVTASLNATVASLTETTQNQQAAIATLLGQIDVLNAETTSLTYQVTTLEQVSAELRKQLAAAAPAIALDEALKEWLRSAT